MYGVGKRERECERNRRWEKERESDRKIEINRVRSNEDERSEKCSLAPVLLEEDVDSWFIAI